LKFCHGLGIQAQALAHQGAETSRAAARAGLRPIQIWAPDGRSPSCRSEAHRRSAAIAASAHAREDRGVHRRCDGLGLWRTGAVTDWGRDGLGR
jgi:hypothetical protein